MTAIIIILVISGYMLMATRAWNNISKAAIAIFIGVAAWLLYMLDGAQFVRNEHAEEFSKYILSAANNSVSVKDFISTHIFVKYITQACEIVLFLLATIGIVKVLNGNNCFGFLCNLLRSRNGKKTIWTLVATTFIISANLDNLTTTVMMLVVMHKIVVGTKLRMIYGSAIVIAANCGGALTVIGDLNGLTLWTKGLITPSAYSAIMVIPIVLMTVITTWLISRLLPERVPVSHQYEAQIIGGDSALKKWQRNVMIVTGIGGLWFIPTFHNLTSLPPFVGALCVLSLLWVVNEIFNLPFIRSEKMVMRHFPIAVQYENIQTILFYIGITLIAGVCIETGATDDLALWITRNTGNIYILGTIWGAISIVLDSIIIIVNNTALYSTEHWHTMQLIDIFGVNGAYWPILNYFCLFGSTLLTISTIGGITLMRMENVSLTWYIRKITPKVAIGGAVGAAAMIIITNLLINQ